MSSLAMLALLAIVCVCAGQDRPTASGISRIYKLLRNRNLPANSMKRQFYESPIGREKRALSVHLVNLKQKHDNPLTNDFEIAYQKHFRLDPVQLR